VEALLLGLSIGLAAGISPGPLLFLVVLSHLPHQALAALGVVGGLFVVWMGIQTLREAPSASLDPTGATALPPHALRRAATVNILSPHPWVSWSTVLGPLTVRTWRGSELGAVALVAGFYVMLIGAKVAVAVLVGRALVAEFLPQLV